MPGFSEPERAGIVYAASKAQGEKAAWEWVRQHKPHFTFNAVLPNLNIGNVRPAFSLWRHDDADSLVRP